MSATSLPPPGELERICKGLAMLDAILCEDWEGRYYSFNRAWSADERMASMRNGSGDEWFILFRPAAIFVKAFWHEYPRGDARRIYAGLPQVLAPQLTEPAFTMEHVTWGGWNDGAGWTLRGDAEPMSDELQMLTGDPQRYCSYAAGYFEVELSVEAVAAVLAGEPLTAALVEEIAPDRSLAGLAADIEEIGYP